LQREAAGDARWVRRITRHSWALYLPETARFEYLLDRPEAEDIGGVINAAMKASADENEELGGFLPRNYNSFSEKDNFLRKNTNLRQTATYSFQN
jgi:type I restriction enzyme M protein